MEVSIVILVLAIVFVSQALRIVPQQSAWVVERLGKYDRTLQAGVNLLVAFVERVC
ncbi:MAG: hypothetical protein ACK5Q1_04255 [Limnobacter sp.]